jgi:hypothetical protein
MQEWLSGLKNPQIAMGDLHDSEDEFRRGSVRISPRFRAPSQTRASVDRSQKTRARRGNCRLSIPSLPSNAALAAAQTSVLTTTTHVLCAAWR